MEQQKPGRGKFRPSEFMRARRPYLFSDTDVSEEAKLDRSTFEYHLGTLTARKQELDFEHFARKLVEKEICPNLRPQTGPTGGGDSKTDAETYPVSHEVSDRWYYAAAEGQKGLSERWAFAFSTKEDWRTKVREDIKGIAQTKRPYSVAYFVTSQFARDKDKASIEDELRGLYGIDVRILDRTWIVDKVFSNRREKLATETLKLTIPLTPAAKKGPRDTSREAELDEIEQQIADPERYRGVDYQLVEDALQAALLARGLERPRVDVDGRFERASRLAEERGTRQQQLRCAYNKAWTHFWWHDDFNSFNRIYDTVEKLAQGSQQTSDLELLQNLWHLLYVSVRNAHIVPNEARLDERTALLERDLARIQKDQGRPSAALHATASLLLIDLFKSSGNSEALKGVLKKFRHIFEKSKGLIDFPALQFAKILMELGEHFAEDETFDEAFESAVLVMRERESSAASGRMLLRRGTQKLKAKRPYEAIRLLGRAQQDLALHESRGEMAAALALCASAYEMAGLRWAARATMLLAASQALKEFWEQGQITVQALACVRKMIWLELHLGRIPCALAWIDAFLVLNNVLGPDAERQRRLQEEWTTIDGILGALLLRTDMFDLKDLAFLPSVLEHLHLDFSRMALLYALGHEDHLRSEKVIPAEETPDAVLAFFSKWVEQPSTGELIRDPEFLDRQTLELQSTVLGCRVTVKLPNNDASLFLAESILAGLEAFLATSLDSPLVPHTPSLQLRIVPRDFMSAPLEFTVTTAPHTVVEISHAREDSSAAASSAPTQDKFVELISTIAAHITVLPENGYKFLQALIRDERGFGRALLITNVETMMNDVLGNKPKLRISDWDPKDNRFEKFPLLRREAWDHVLTKSAREPGRRPPKFGKGEPPSELFDVERLKHTDRKVLSLINMDLWNKAGWTATGFAISLDQDKLPFLMLGFKDLEAAKHIFAGWQEELGRSDLEERLRICVVTGIDSDNPHAYRILVGSNSTWSASERAEGQQLVYVSRINRMDPTSSANLDRFLESYRRTHEYLLMPAKVKADSVESWAPKLGILKRELVVRPAWQIGRHDPDGSAIDADDKIIIPEEISAVPVLELLAWKKAKETKPALGSFPGVSAAWARTKKPGRNDPCYCGSGKKYKKCHGR